MMSRSSRGFTLIEFLLTVGIFLTLAGMAPAFYSRFVLQDAVAETADRLAFSLRNASGFSLAGKDDSSWGVAIDGTEIVLFRGANFATRDASADRRVSIPSTVAITGFTETTFARVSGAPSASATVSITASGGAARTVRLNEFGVVSRE